MPPSSRTCAACLGPQAATTTTTTTASSASVAKLAAIFDHLGLRDGSVVDVLAAVWRGPLTEAEVDSIHAAYLPKGGRGDHRQRLVHDLYAVRYRNASVPLTDAHMARIMAKDVWAHTWRFVTTLAARQDRKCSDARGT